MTSDCQTLPSPSQPVLSTLARVPLREKMPVSTILTLLCQYILASHKSGIGTCGCTQSPQADQRMLQRSQVTGGTHLISAHPPAQGSCRLLHLPGVLGSGDGERTLA